MKLDVVWRARQFIGGKWVESYGKGRRGIVNPATEETVGATAVGTVDDINDAVKAARNAFPAWAALPSADRIALFEAAIGALTERHEDLARAITTEMGAPIEFSRNLQAMTGVWHMGVALELLKNYPLEEAVGTTRVVREPIGVCAIITPWNWPLNQLVCKVAPALAAGCTVVVKPADLSPISAMIFAECLDAAGFPAGVFNLVTGPGSVLGTALASHPDVDMVSFTGSTRAGVQVAINAAPTVKRVSQELGGKSANILVDDASFTDAVAQGVASCFSNSGQTCVAPTRMLVPKARLEEACEIARRVASETKVGDPLDPTSVIGPVASESQYNIIQRYIETGISEGANLVVGGAGRPDGLSRGYYVKPTVFSHVTSKMTIAQEEIFGPVLSIMAYETDDEAVEIANDSPFGLSGYVSAVDIDRARSIARRLRTGMVHLNGAAPDFFAPFGGYKQSGNGREWGKYGLEEFMEIKAIMGYESPEKAA